MFRGRSNLAIGAALAMLGSACSPCPDYADPALAGNVALAELTEASGLAASRRNPGVLWTHNDSGDGPRVFALDSGAAWLGTYVLDGAGAFDWEDMAVGPGPDPTASYLYVGDIGDNNEARPSVTVYRAAEPFVEGPPVEHILDGVEALEIVYSDGPHNSETLLVDPANGDLYLLTKPTGTDGTATLFHAAAPLSTNQANEAVPVATLTFGTPPLGGSTKPTGGDIDAARQKLIIRSYTGVFLWCWEQPEDSVATVIAGEPCSAPAASELQGEAVAFAASGGSYFTLGERAFPPLYRYDRVD